MAEILQRAREMFIQLGQQFLQASVYRLAWSLPVSVVIVVAIVIFILLAVLPR